MTRSIPPPRFPRSTIAPSAGPSIDDLEEADLIEEEPVADRTTAMRAPPVPALPVLPGLPVVEPFDVLAEDVEEVDDDEVLDEGELLDDDVGESAPTQTRPAIVLPPPRVAERPKEPWVVHAESLLDTIERTDDRPRRMALHRELAELLREHGDAGQAFEVLVSALAEDVDDDATAAALEALAHAHDRLGDLLRTALAWSEDIEWMRDRPRLGTLLVRIAKWYGEDVGKVEWGLPFAERAKRLLPDSDARPWVTLARLRRRQKKWAEAEAALAQALARTTPGPRRAELEVERGRLAAARGEPVSTVCAAYAAALDADPTSEDAVRALDAELDKEPARIGERIAVWERRVAAVRAPIALEDARQRLVDLLLVAGHDGRAATVLEDMIAADPEHRRALKQLGEVHARRGDSAGLRRTLERSIEVAASPREKIGHLLELVALLEELRDYDAEGQALEEILEIDPGHRAAHDALAELHRTRGRLHALVELIERRVAAVGDRGARVRYLLEAVRVLAEELGEPERALELAQKAVEISPQSTPALCRLARLLEQAGEVGEAEDVARRALELGPEPRDRAALLRLQARLRRRDGAAAEEVRDLLGQALDLEPDDREALVALRELAATENDPAGVARALERELASTATDGAAATRVPLLLELARVRKEQLGDLDGAIAAWEEALYLDATCTEAAAGLVEPYAERGHFHVVHTLASLLLSAGRTTDRAQRARWNALHGRALQAMGRAAEASSALAEAVRLDASDVESLVKLAEARFAAEDWDGAFQADHRLLSALDPGDERLLAVHFRIGTVEHERGRTRAAVAAFQQALAIDPEHRPTLERLSSLHVERKAWREAIEVRQRLAEITPHVDERIPILLEVAEIQAGPAHDPRGAVGTLEDALDLRKGDHVLQHKLLEAYQRVDAWPEMTGLLEKIAAADDNPRRRAKYFYTLAQIQRDKARDLDKAAASFERALDEDPTLLKAFEAVDRIHTQARAWKPLERAYRRMLHRVAKAGAEPGLEVQLWTALGLLYRDRMRDDVSAIEAFKMAARTRPDDAKVRRILAELHGRRGSVDEAAAELHHAIEQHPLHAEPYRALFRLYREAGRVDRAYCLGHALVLLEKADDETRRFCAVHQHKGAPTFRSRLDGPTFTRAVCHPEEDVLVAKLFELMLPAVRASRAIAMRASIAPPPNVPWEDRLTTKVPLARAFFACADVLAIPAPRLSLRVDLDAMLVPVATEPPSTVAGRRALSLTRPEQMLFAIGQHLSGWRGDAHLRVLFPGTQQQEQLLLVGLKLGKPDLSLPAGAEARIVEDARTLARHLSPVDLEGLRVVVKRFLAQGGRADLKAFARGVELTAARAGLLLAGDLPTAVRSFDDARLAAVGVPASEVVRDLVAWFVSPAHLELREQLGCGVGR